MSILGRRRARSPRTVMTLVMTVLAVLVVALPSFAAAGISGTFESDDGNLENDGDTDWNDLVGGAGIPVDLSTDGEALDYVVVPDHENSGSDVVYAPSTKHDADCPPLKSKKEQNKSDFIRFGIADEKAASGDTFVYLYWIRTEQNSTSASGHASFELNQGTTPCGGSTDEAKNVVREAGDVLFVYDFEGGPGQIPTITAYRWIDAAGNGGNGDTGLTAADCETSSSLPCWGEGSGDLVAAGTADARVNDAEIGPVFDAISGGDLGTVTFGEAAVNFNAAGIFAADECTGFGQARVSSRASGNSFDATLKDWVEPAEVSITNCGSVLVHKVDKDDTSTLLPGAKFVISEDDVLGGTDDVAMTELSDGIFCADDLFAGDYHVFETQAPDEYELDPNNPQTVSVTADGSVCSSDRVDDDPDLTFENERLRGSILVQKLDEDGQPLDGASFEYAAGEPSDDPGSLTWTALPATVNDGQFCVDDLEFGDYVVRETDAPTGYDAITDVAETDVTEKSTCADRIGDGYQDPENPADTADATYENSPTPGRVFINKTDDTGTPMAGITFELWTAKDDGSGGLEPDTTTDRSCVTDAVGDCYEPDPDATDTTLGFQNVDLGEYCIVEGTLPDGYDSDPALPECFEIELTDGGDEFTFGIVNPRTHRIIVLTCHEGSDTLVSSDVSLDGGTAVSSLSGLGLTAAQQKALCDLGGASFGDLSGHNTHDLDVTFNSH